MLPPSSLPLSTITRSQLAGGDELGGIKKYCNELDRQKQKIKEMRRCDIITEFVVGIFMLLTAVGAIALVAMSGGPGGNLPRFIGGCVYGGIFVALAIWCVYLIVQARKNQKEEQEKVTELFNSKVTLKTVYADMKNELNKERITKALEQFSNKDLDAIDSYAYECVFNTEYKQGNLNERPEQLRVLTSIERAKFKRPQRVNLQKKYAPDFAQLVLLPLCKNILKSGNKDKQLLLFSLRCVSDYDKKAFYHYLAQTLNDKTTDNRSIVALYFNEYPERFKQEICQNEYFCDPPVPIKKRSDYILDLFTRMDAKVVQTVINSHFELWRLIRLFSFLIRGGAYKKLVPNFQKALKLKNTKESVILSEYKELSKYPNVLVNLLLMNNINNSNKWLCVRKLFAKMEERNQIYFLELAANALDALEKKEEDNDELDNDELDDAVWACVVSCVMTPEKLSKLSCDFLDQLGRFPGMIVFRLFVLRSKIDAKDKLLFINKLYENMSSNQKKRFDKAVIDVLEEEKPNEKGGMYMYEKGGEMIAKWLQIESVKISKSLSNLLAKLTKSLENAKNWLTKNQLLKGVVLKKYQDLQNRARVIFIKR